MNSICSDFVGNERVHEVSDSLSASRIPAWKRVLDCTLVLLTAPLWFPVIVLMAIWVKLVSPGPALFRQERIGHLGARFLILKLRTMKVNADTTVHRDHLANLMTSNQPMRKLDSKGDSRLIPGGLWLRTLGIDELPQLLNVLKGDMSLVGPRPTTAYEFEMFQPHYRQRCRTLPGLTGLWQVNGKNRTTFEKMMELDLAYVEKKSLMMDLSIIAFTPAAILIQLWDVKFARRRRNLQVPTANPPSRLATEHLRSSVPAAPGEATNRILAAGARRSGIQAAPEPMDR